MGRCQIRHAGWDCAIAAVNGVVLWSGDVWSNWRDFKAQIVAGLHAGLSGIGVWTTDIGGFYDGHGRDPEFRQLLERWFQFGVFGPICRLHGFRVPEHVPFPQPETSNPYGQEKSHVSLVAVRERVAASDRSLST